MTRDRWFDWAAQDLSCITEDILKRDTDAQIMHVQNMMNDIRYHINEAVLDLIGPNEPYGDAPTNGDKIIRNNLRDELREKVKEL